MELLKLRSIKYLRNSITVSSAFSQTPNANTVWLLQDDTVQAQKFRVITVEEQDE